MTKELSRLLYALVGAILAGSGVIALSLGTRGDAQDWGAFFMLLGAVFLFPIVRWHVGRFLAAAKKASSPGLAEPPKDTSPQ